jgi:chemotaxis protein methyltransferase CheR
MHSPDIILYRNVSIYFPGQVQREIFGRLAELLAEGGCLLVGASETLHHDIGILSLVKRDSLFFYHKRPKIVFEERRTSSRHVSAREPVRGRFQQTAYVDAVRPGGHQGRMENGHGHALSRSPSNVPPLLDVRERFDEAIGLAHNGQHETALAKLDEIIARDSTFEKAYSLKGSLLLSASRFDEARAVCEAILERDQLCLEAYLMLGMIARHDGDNECAFRRFRDALYLNPSCWLAHFYTGEILFAQRDVKRARNSFEAALKTLGQGEAKEHGRAFFPLSFNAEQFIVICRHKLSLLPPQKG